MAFPANETKSSRAGLILPVGRIHRLLKKGRYAKHIGAGAAVYAASVLEYLVAEIMELSNDQRTNDPKKRHRINPRHLTMAIQTDSELAQLLKGVQIPAGGVVPYIHSELLPKVKSAKKNPKKTVQAKKTKAKETKKSNEIMDLDSE